MTLVLWDFLRTSKPDLTVRQILIEGFGIKYLTRIAQTIKVILNKEV
jgi:hypothetical protein